MVPANDSRQKVGIIERVIAASRLHADRHRPRSRAIAGRPASR
jgi:hypothetical protein